MTTASIEAHPQEDAAYDYSAQQQQQYQNPYQETYMTQNPQSDQQQTQHTNQNFREGISDRHTECPFPNTVR